MPSIRLLIAAAVAATTLAAGAARAETVTGTFRFLDGDDSALVPIALAKVEIWRFRPRALGVWSWGNDLTTTTDVSGQLAATVPFVQAGVITTVRVYATNAAATVMTQDLPSQPFYLTPGSPTELQRTTVGAGDVLDFTFSFGSSFAQAHYNAAEALRRGRDYVNARRDPAETDGLPPVAVMMNTAGVNAWDPFGSVVRATPLTGLDDVSLLVLYAAHVMTSIGSYGPISPSDHCNYGDPGQAWRMAFPLYFARAVAHAHPGVVNGPGTLALGPISAIETPSCGGVTSPGARLVPFVAGALFDLIDDSPGELFDDLCTPGPSHDTTIMQIVDRELDLGWFNPDLQRFTDAWIARGRDLPPLLSIFSANNQFPVTPAPLVRTDLLPAANLMTFRGGTWRIRGGVASVVTLGAAGDRAVPADYDGDGITDLSVWNPITAAWTTTLSATGQTRTINWGFGTAGEVPLAGDFDGDAEADLAVFWPALNRVYVHEDNCGGSRTITTGAGVPVVGDFDGDGRDEPAMYQSATGEFRVVTATGTFTLAVTGTSGGTPVAADFDGDGKTDVAVFQPGTGNWHVRRSGTGVTTVTSWGASNETPAPADVDGDGRADFVTYVAGTARWFVLEADGPASTFLFGDTAAAPAPAP